MRLGMTRYGGLPVSKEVWTGIGMEGKETEHCKGTYTTMGSMPVELSSAAIVKDAAVELAHKARCWRLQDVLSYRY